MTRDTVMPKVLVRLALVSLSLVLLGACTDAAPEWELIWADEFDGAAGELPDPANWRFDIGTDWGNAQLEYDTDRPENVSLDGNGHLAITARRESYQGSSYTSGRIKTQGLFEQERGRFEARIQLPRGQGLWPAFWMLGQNFDTVGWPDCGEIDIMEYRGQEPSRVFGTVHGPGYSGSAAVSRVFDLAQDRFDTGFHVFAIEWGVDYIDWFVDGTAYFRVTPEDVTGSWVFDQPFFILLNLAVGGTIVGPPGASTPFPQSMLVDWVRVYAERS
jgi:beta-glucanase (GH16 family)